MKNLTLTFLFFLVLSFSLLSCERYIEHSVIDNTTSIEVDQDFINFRNGLYLFYDTYQEGDVLFLQLKDDGVEWRSGSPQNARAEKEYDYESETRIDFAKWVYKKIYALENCVEVGYNSETGVYWAIIVPC